MASQEKKLESLLGLAAPGERKSRSQAVANALRAAILLVDADAASVHLPSARKKDERLVLYAGSDVPAALPVSATKSEALKALGAERQALAVSDLKESPELATTDGCPGVEAGPVLFAPVEARGGELAYLAVYRKRGRARYTAGETELMLLLGAWLGVALEGLRRLTKAERLAATIDGPETQDARGFKSTLRRELRRASRYGHELSVLKIDVDFAPSDAGNGADGADGACADGAAGEPECAREIATILSRLMRSFDVLGWHPQHGFLAALPHTGRSGALELAERIRAAVESHTFATAGERKPILAVGVAAFPGDGLEVDALLAKAGRAVEGERRKAA
jgi:diguanylate cyclase (GGDEF)-like protein